MKNLSTMLMISVMLSYVFSLETIAQEIPAFYSADTSCNSTSNSFSISNEVSASEFAHPIVRIAYLIPSNRSPQDNGVEALQYALKTGQQYYKDQMQKNGFGSKTFEIETEADGVTPLIHVVSLDVTDDYLREDLWNRSIQTAFNKGISVWTAGEVWILLPEAHLMQPDGSMVGSVALGASHATGNSPGVVVLGSNALALFTKTIITDDRPYHGKILPNLGLYPMQQDVTFPWFEGNTLSSVASSALGALFHEMGHAFGLPHDYRNDNNFHGNLLYNGLRGIRGSLFPNLYPEDYTRLSYSSSLILNVNHYFNRNQSVTSSPTIHISIPATVVPQKGLLHISFAAEDNDGLSFAHLRYEGNVVAEVLLDGENASSNFETSYYSPGTENEYTIAVYDVQGNIAYQNVSVFVQGGGNQAPRPFVRIDPAVPDINEAVTLNASKSYDPDNAPLTLIFEWDVDNDGIYDLDPVAEMKTPFQYPAPGNYYVKLKVTDPGGNQSVSTPLNVSIPGTYADAKVAELSLFDADKDKLITKLVDGAEVEISALQESNFNITASTTPEKVDSVLLVLQGEITHIQTEKKLPYALFGDNQGDLNGRNLLPGPYNLKVTPYSEGKAGETKSIAFQLIATMPGLTALWEKKYDGRNTDELHKVVATSDGGYLLAGTYNYQLGYGRFESEYWIVRIDSKGNPLWDKIFNGNEYDDLKTAIATSDGGFLLGGTSESAAGGDKSEANKGPSDFWIIKIDQSGNKEWDKTFGSEGFDGFSSMAQATDGGYLIGGNSSASASGDKSENNKGGIDFWILKVDANGNKIWDKTFGGSDNDLMTCILTSSIGGYLLGGYSNSSASSDKTEDSKGDYDFWLVHIDANGNKLWDKTLGGSEDDRLTSIKSNQKGGYLLGGYSNSSASSDKTEDSKGDYDFWLVHIDQNGQTNWDKTLGGNSSDQLRDVLLTPEGEYLLGGSSKSSISGDKTGLNKGNTDFWVVKLDTHGNKIWDKSLGSEIYEYLSSLTKASDEGYILGGFNIDYDQEPFYGDFCVIRLLDETPPILTSLSLINAQTDQLIDELKEGDVIDITDISSAKFSIQAHISGQLDSVVMKLHGPLQHVQSEKKFPYVLFGDNQYDYYGQIFPTGDYSITVTSYYGGEPYNTLALAFSITNSMSAPALVWEKTLGGSGFETPASAIATADGGYLLTGTSDSPVSGDKSTDKQGFWLIKTDANGNKLWDKSFSSSGSDGLYQTIATTDGGYLLAGTSDGPASEDKSENSKGGVDYWIVKVDKEGNKQWDKTLGGSSDDELRHICVSPDKTGYVLAGQSASNSSGDKSENSRGIWDYWIVKVDLHGNKIWDKTFGGNDEEYLWSIVPTAKGSYLLGGQSISDASGDKSEDSNGLSDFWLVKIDAHGNKIWDKTLGGSGHENLLEIVNSYRQGEYLLAGNSSSDISGDKSENSKGGSDYWLVKINEEGNILWDKTLGGNALDELLSAIPAPDGSFVLGGYSISAASGDKSEDSRGGRDYWLVKVDVQGNKIWDKTLGGSDDDYLWGVIRTLHGNYLLAGSSRSDMSGDKSENTKGFFDFWIVKIEGEGIPLPQLKSLTLLDSKNDRDLQELQPDDMISFTDISAAFLSVRANTLPQKVDSVLMQLQGPLSHLQTEKQLPYALFGDSPAGNYRGKNWAAGQYTIAITPYQKGFAGPTFCLSFTLSPEFSITRFTLIDASLDQEICELKDGQVLDLSTYNNHLLTIRADTEPQHIEQVNFELSGALTHSSVERKYPYALFGDTGKADGSRSYDGIEWQEGSYSLTATPYSSDKQGQPYSIAFEVKESNSLPSAEHHLKVSVYPIPSQGIINIVHENDVSQAEWRVFNARGILLLRQPINRFNTEQIDLSTYPKGIYYLKIVSPDAVQTLRIVLDY
ncbi:hypothetical protein OKW21_001788 [Catalinimonas alkaloidigena]|uniref:T9SS type A sorting domain-containing protein n=1 Tax=Catalinimonas alkaloidigena TaxID=1075417 RepID=UPI002407697B|nr:T9SS type A sorting domain-containing protein [Catalinimonas alkaloidigena]MDF9796525.1 hypothetical protein [Catalinimonas alkaloidigena]